MTNALRRVDAAFEFFTKLGVPYYTFHDRDVAPEGQDILESNAKLDEVTDYMLEKQQATGVKLLWGTANLFSNPRYAIMHGVSDVDGQAHRTHASQIHEWRGDEPRFGCLCPRRGTSEEGHGRDSQARRRKLRVLGVRQRLWIGFSTVACARSRFVLDSGREGYQSMLNTGRFLVGRRFAAQRACLTPVVCWHRCEDGTGEHG